MSIFLIHIISFFGTVFIFDFFETEKPTLTRLQTTPIVFLNTYLTYIASTISENYINNNINNNIKNVQYDNNILTPTYINILKFIPVLGLVNIYFSLLHYAFHKNKFLYKNIHYIHHQLIITDGFSAFYSHPIEHIFANIFSPIIALYLVNANIELAYFSIAILSVSTAMAHTHFKGQKSTHNLHHIYQVYNYDNFPNLLDRYMGTYFSL